MHTIKAHTHAHTRIHTHTHSHTLIHTNTHTDKHKCTLTHTNTQTNTQTHIHKYMFIFINEYSECYSSIGLLYLHIYIHFKYEYCFGYINITVVTRDSGSNYSVFLAQSFSVLHTICAYSQAINSLTVRTTFIIASYISSTVNIISVHIFNIYSLSHSREKPIHVQQELQNRRW